MLEITCARCGTRKARNTGEVNRARRMGKPLYCSLVCAGVVRAEKATGGVKWHQARFMPRPNAIETACAECGRAMWLPASKVAMYKRCGPACSRAWHESRKSARDRHCETCGKQFRPRGIQLANGGGIFCSQACNTRARDALLSPESQAKARAAYRALEAQGKIKRYKGEENPRWAGGKKASVARRTASGKNAASIRAYRKKNPHKIREFAQRRRGRKLGRLEYGSIPRIGGLQKWKCAICRTGIKGGYHVDHIMPLALGGEHKARNVQLLCGSCNVRKNAKDPIRYMQEIGRLL